MSNAIARIALLGVVVFAGLALVTLVRGDYMIAGASFLAVSFLLYVRETRK